LLVSKCWGDAGSQTADLALNVMAAYFPHVNDGPGIRMADGSTVSEAAYRLHRAFKFAYLVRMSDQGGVVPETEIRRWLALQLGGRVKKARDAMGAAATPPRPRVAIAPAK